MHVRNNQTLGDLFRSSGNTTHGTINIYKQASTYNCGVGTVFYFGVIAAVLALLLTMCFLCSEKLLEEDEEEDEDDEENALEQASETTNLDVNHFQGDQGIQRVPHHKEQEMPNMEMGHAAVLPHTHSLTNMI